MAATDIEAATWNRLKCPSPAKEWIAIAAIIAIFMALIILPMVFDGQIITYNYKTVNRLCNITSPKNVTCPNWSDAWTTNRSDLGDFPKSNLM